MLTEGQHIENQVEYQWIVISDPTSAERNKLINKLGLPDPFFEREKEKEMASFHSYYTHLNEEGFVLHVPLWKESEFSSLNQAKDSLTLYHTMRVTVFLTDHDHHERVVRALDSAESPLKYVTEKILKEYGKISLILDDLQERIVEIENIAKVKADRGVLLQLATLEQEIVIVSSRLDEYEETMNRFLKHHLLKNSLNVNYREDIRLAIKKAHYRIHLYKDLVESTSGLLSDSIDNKLNTIMEYLETWTLVISIPTLIFSLYGINTSGVIGRESSHESWVVIVLALALAIATAWWLRKKEFK